jgi:hemolysin activation/secretion protein
MRHQPRSLAAALACLSFSAWAQYIPDAGALMRQTEQMLRQKSPVLSVPRLEPLPPAMVINENTDVMVFRFKFNGNQRLSTDQLQDVVAPFAHKSLRAHDLQHLTDAVSEAYRQAGWLVQAYIPRQDFSGGEMTLQVIESIPPNKPKP